MHLEKKVYSWKDLIIIPFMCDSFSTIMLAVQKLLTAFVAVVQVVILAIFLDSMALTLGEGTGQTNLILWFVLLSVCIGWRRVSFLVGKFFICRLRVNAAVQMGQAFMDKLSQLPYSLLENEDSWDLIERVCKNPEQQVRLMLQRTLNLILYIMRISGVLYIVFVNVWWVGVLAALMVGPLLIFAIKSGERGYNSQKKATAHERRYQYLGDILSGRESASERVLFSFSDSINKEWEHQYEKTRKIKLIATKTVVCTVKGGSAAVVFFSSLIAVFLLFPLVKGTISIGMYIALVTGMYDLVNMVGFELVKTVSQLSQCKEYLKDLTEFSNLDEVKGVNALSQKVSISFEMLEFRNVTFSYPGTLTPILKNCNFTIKKGEHYAFVGANGTGKTTITKLLMQLYDNYEGNILVNGRELRTYTFNEIKTLFCGVYQDFSKYYISLADNVLLGNLAIKRDDEVEGRVRSALYQVGLWEEVQELPLGIYTPLGKILEGGVDLSEGQWQKLAMSRAIVSTAPIIILDEPTAALDPVSECELYERFSVICKNKTSIFISQRLGSTKLADKIFVLDDGCVVEEGTYEELLARNGLYAEMYNSQKGWYEQ